MQLATEHTNLKPVSSSQGFTSPVVGIPASLNTRSYVVMARWLHLNRRSSGCHDQGIHRGRRRSGCGVGQGA